MKVKRIQSLERLTMMEKEWNQLLFASEQNCPFLTHEWISTWWECFSKENSLEILLFFDERENLVGIAPLMFQGNILRFIASQEVSDYCDFFSSGSNEEFYAKLMDFMTDEFRDIKKIELMNIHSSSPTLEYLPLLSENRGFFCFGKELDVSPQLKLPSTYEKYMESLGKKTRHELRRKLRRMESLNGFTIKKMTETEGLQSAVETFIELHRKSSPAKSRFWKTESMPDFFRKITHRFSLKRWVELNFLCFDERVLAALLNFSFADQIYFFNAAFDRQFAKYSPGIYLFHRCVEEAISGGKRRADFLRGGERYKYYFGAEDSKIHLLVLTPEKN